MLAKFSGFNPKGPNLGEKKQKKKLFVLCLPTPQSGRVKLGSFMSQSFIDCVMQVVVSLILTYRVLFFLPFL